MKNPLRTLGTEALYAQLGRIVESIPQLAVPRPNAPSVYLPLTREQLLWLGRAEALVEEALGGAAGLEFRSAMANFNRYPVHTEGEIQRLLYRALAQVEMELPTPPSNAFIPAGNAFDALKGIQRIFSFSSADVMIVDPYLDEKFFMEFAQFAPDGVPMRLLTVRASKRETLAPTLRNWRKQHGVERPVSIRSAPSSTLHDRAILIDGNRVWTIGQSFNALAARAPTSFVEADIDTAKMKVEAYNDLWASAEELNTD